MKHQYLFIVFILSLFSLIAWSEPAPWGIIINGNECSAYWTGDECVSFKRPDGWKELYSYQFKDGVIRFGKKKCKGQKKTVTSVRWEQTCCEQLGLKYRVLEIEAQPINTDLVQCSGDRNKQPANH